MVFDYFEDESDDIYLSLSIQCIIYYLNLYLSLQKKDTATAEESRSKKCALFIFFSPDLTKNE